MKSDPAAEAQIMKTLESLWDAYGKQDMAGVLGFYAPDADSVNIGTGADERRVGIDACREAIERDFAQSEGADIAITWSQVSAKGDVGWAAFECDATIKTAQGETTFPCRYTAVVERRGGKWLVVQSHISAPWGQQKEGESFPTD